MRPTGNPRLFSPSSVGDPWAIRCLLPRTLPEARFLWQVGERRKARPPTDEPPARRVRRTVHALRRRPRASRGSIVAFQSECLRDLVRHASRDVLTAGRCSIGTKFAPRAIQASATSRRFPSPRRATSRRGRARSWRGLDAARLQVLGDGGSLGEPFEIRRTPVRHNLLTLFRWQLLVSSASAWAIASPKSSRPLSAHCMTTGWSER